jgi:hypothetical protein
MHISTMLKCILYSKLWTSKEYLCIGLVIICMLFDDCCRHVLNCKKSGSEPSCEENDTVEATEDEDMASVAERRQHQGLCYFLRGRGL